MQKYLSLNMNKMHMVYYDIILQVFYNKSKNAHKDNQICARNMHNYTEFV